MRKIFLFIMVLFCLCVFAQAEEAVSYVYSTDIRAYVNGCAIPSYNIGGRTVILAEDLEDYSGETYCDYGFDVWYFDETRSLVINSNGDSPLWGTSSVEKGTVGEIVGQVYKSDIKVLFNSFEVTGYNIGGKTAICIEEIGAVDETSPNYVYGYSKYMCNSEWNEAGRYITLNTYQENNFDYFVNYPIRKLAFKFTDNKLSVSFNQENSFFNTVEYDFSEEFLADTYKIKDVISEKSGEKIGTMYLSWNQIKYFSLDETKIQEMTEGLAEILTYDEAVKYAEDNYTILNTLENEDARIYLAQKGDTKYLLLAMKSGGFVLADEFPPTYTTVELSAVDMNDQNSQYADFYVEVAPFAGTPGSGVNSAQYMYETDYYSFR